VAPACFAPGAGTLKELECRHIVLHVQTEDALLEAAGWVAHTTSPIEQLRGGVSVDLGPQLPLHARDPENDAPVGEAMVTCLGQMGASRIVVFDRGRHLE